MSLLEWRKLKTVTTTVETPNSGNDVQQLKLSRIADGNIKQQLFWKQFGGFYKVKQNYHTLCTCKNNEQTRMW